MTIRRDYIRWSYDIWPYQKGSSDEGWWMVTFVSRQYLLNLLHRQW